MAVVIIFSTLNATGRLKAFGVFNYAVFILI
jgi:hypothetical protein